MQSQNKTIILSLLVALSIGVGLSFQNCSGGFTSNDGPTTSQEVEISSTPSNESNPVQTGPRLLYDGKFNELQGFTLKIVGTGTLTFPDGLPKGAVYDAKTRRINWIPAKGQAGFHRFKVFEDGKEIGYVTYTVGAIDDQKMQVAGPPSIYSDGDIGYIFVHGAGDVDRCANRDDLARYWGTGPAIVAPDASNRYIACYDSRKAVKDVAVGVAQQILNAPCGRYNKCVIITHSMGGLLMEHMFLHTRAAHPNDPEPAMFGPREIYQSVKDRTLLVISLASAAGGSKAASIVNRDGPRNLSQEAVGAISRVMGMNDDSTRNLVVSYAANVVAPYLEDPGVPFFMVPGFTERTAAEASGILGSLWDLTVDDVPLIVYNADRSLALLDSIVQFQSRSDGLVDLRSGCGVASAVEDEGPGRSVSLDTHFKYCWNARKKPNHHVWFLTNMNHYIITGQSFNCKNPDVPCVTLFPNREQGTFLMDPGFTGLSAMEVIRRRLADPASTRATSLADIE